MFGKTHFDFSVPVKLSNNINNTATDTPIRRYFQNLNWLKKTKEITTYNYELEPGCLNRSRSPSLCCSKTFKSGCPVSGSNSLRRAVKKSTVADEDTIVAPEFCN